MYIHQKNTNERSQHNLSHQMNKRHQSSTSHKDSNKSPSFLRISSIWFSHSTYHLPISPSNSLSYFPLICLFISLHRWSPLHPNMYRPSTRLEETALRRSKTRIDFFTSVTYRYRERERDAVLLRWTIVDGRWIPVKKTWGGEAPRGGSEEQEKCEEKKAFEISTRKNEWAVHRDGDPLLPEDSSLTDTYTAIAIRQSTRSIYLSTLTYRHVSMLEEE